MKQWTSVKGFNYVVSFGGLVMNKTSCNILKLSTDSVGYKYVTFYKKGKYCKHRIHRLVATAYLEKIKDKNEVNHIDGDKTNNHYTNLEWCTRKENQVHAVKTGLLKRKLTPFKVKQIRKLLIKGMLQKDIAKKYGVHQTIISSIKCGRSWTWLK